MVKTNSDVKSIRKKLLAAVAMLLVASIMVVSSSYAWFTLSTAPEVTGIQTSVGSNGNLEMALRLNSSLDTITSSSVGYEFPVANQYWGNLVDLSDGSYRLNEIALRPARLNAVVDENASVQAKGGTDNKLAWKSADGGDVYYADAKANAADTPVWEKTAYKLATTGYLKTPVYGADGRLSALEANTVNGVYDDSEGKKAFVANSSNFGVRAVGVTSNITPEALALRNAKLTVNNAITEGKGNATYSLRNDAAKLAQIYVATRDNADATVTETDIGYIRTTVGRLNSILVDLEDALKAAVVAVGLSEGESFTADKVSFVVAGNVATDITVADVTLDWDFDAAGDPLVSPSKTDLLSAYTTLLSVKGTLSTAASNLNNLQPNGTGDNGEALYNMSAVTPILSTLLSKNDFKINGGTADELMSKPYGELISMINGTVNVEITSGVYAVIAKLVGNYSGGGAMVVDAGTVGGQEIGEVTLNVLMSTTVQPDAATMPNGFHLPYVQDWMSNLVVSGADGGEAPELITDIYGYIVDLAFRTNATGSTLQLQTDAANRVNDSAATQGAGSYMEFTVANADYTVKQMIDLLQNVRVVFVDNNDVICGVAKLDVAYGTAEPKIENPDPAKTYIDGVAAADGTAMVHELTAGTLTENTVKAALYLYDFTVGAAGQLTMGAKKITSDITSLQQNVAAGVSALVFLDGDGVENGDVAISGNSATGTMNLQFSSSASLTPMNYTFQEKLATPVISIDANKLTISAPAEVDYSTETNVKYVVYVDGSALPVELTNAEYDLETVQGLIGGRAYSIAVVVKADGKLPSDKSVPVNWTAPMA